ncbi:hypothetical protein [Chromobacterium sp. IIBBL 290-4]|uniref:hypothetical protein n=1 Tax=Chromobacterium sp. IIBBL 290-4 TaxID=2953890 RepID=UPI0020B71A64|nr:hypothetical protein [Chromobacterium sp. IIBBL 290-4]UTH73301.1 hypothetical protein NKT35_17440 [Chromobacterium sp. IIBBL 290-4]
MKKIEKILAVGIFALAAGMSLPASAVTITPPGPNGAAAPFTAVGPAVVGKSGVEVDCTVTFSGTVDGGGNILISNVVFKGIPVCRMIKASATPDTPWVGKVLATDQLSFDNASVSVNTPILGGLCGPSQVGGKIVDSGSQTSIVLSNAPLSGGCSISATVSTTPYMHVSP